MDKNRDDMTDDGPVIDPVTLGKSRLPPDLEERVVGELRGRGLLRAPAVKRASSQRRQLPWVVAAIAAVLAFAVGLRVGQRTPVQPRAAGTTELREAAFDYVTALSMVRDADSSGTAAALETFRAAADQIVRLAPRSEIAVAIQMAFPGSFVFSHVTSQSTAPSPKRILWF